MKTENGSGRPHHVRFKFLIYPRFQLILIVVNIVILGGALFLVGFQTVRSFAALRQMGIDVQLPPNHAYFKFLDFETTTFLSHLAIAFIGGFVLSSLFTLLFSHRLAGPLVRLKRYFSDFAKTSQEIKPLSFRKGDFFNDLPPVINEALGRIRDHKKGDAGGK